MPDVKTVFPLILVLLLVNGCSSAAETPTTPAIVSGGSLAIGTSAPGGKGKKEVATYTVSIDGHVMGGPETRRDDGDSQIVVSQPGIAIDLSWFQSLAGGSDCFADAVYSGSLDVHTDRRDASRAETFFFFRATGAGSDAETEVKYQLTLDGTVHGHWPPAIGETSFVTGGEWTLQTEGRGQKRIGCVGVGELGYTISVTRDS